MGRRDPRVPCSGDTADTQSVSRPASVATAVWPTKSAKLHVLAWFFRNESTDAASDLLLGHAGNVHDKDIRENKISALRSYAPPQTFV